MNTRPPWRVFHIPSPVEAVIPLAMAQAHFVEGQRVRCREDGMRGTVVMVNDDGHPKVLMDGEDEARWQYGARFEVSLG